MQKLNQVEHLARVNARKWCSVTTVDTRDILAIAEAFRAMEQRAEAAEAKLAELEKQQPIGMVVGMLGAGLRVSCYFMPDTVSLGNELFTRPAPAVNLAELVPDSGVEDSIDKLKKGYFRRWIKEYSSKEAKSGYVAGGVNVKDIVNVFNYADACAAMLRNIEEATK